MSATAQDLESIEYSGSQLGTPDWSMKFKGCAYIHANKGSGSDKRIVLSYMYNPQGRDYTVTFNSKFLSISYTATATIYSKSETIRLDY